MTETIDGMTCSLGTLYRHKDASIKVAYALLYSMQIMQMVSILHVSVHGVVAGE